MDSEKNQYDIWDHATQKSNYDAYRPRYPKQFLQNPISLLKQHKNYLDIATGTGAIIFPLHPYFSDLCLGIDISPKQIETAIEKTKQLDKNNIRFEVMNFMDLPDFMSKNDIPKFDFVTIGQALHWFDVQKFLKILKNNILKEKGTFSVLGYFCKGFEFNLKDQNNQKKGLGYERYKEWYKIIEKYFDCDRESLEQGFGKVPFDKFFKVVEKEEFIDKWEISNRILSII